VPQQLSAPAGGTGAEQAKRGRKRKARSGLVRLGARVTERARFARCGRVPILEGDQRRRVEVRVLETGKPEDPRVAHYAGVQLCGCVWLCPVCGPNIRQKRAVELDRAAVQWIDRYGAGSVMLLTLTLPHDEGERLTTVLGALQKGRAALMSGRGWQELKARFGLAHYVRAHDFTFGFNGWHPHDHDVLFSRRVLAAGELEELRELLAARWGDAVARQYRRRPSLEHGVQLEQARSLKDVNRYVCQVVVGSEDRFADDIIPVAYEVTRGDLKTSRRSGHLTPWELLELTQDRRQRDDAAELWLEYERGTKGVHAIQWSRGLRRELALEPEQSDEELVAQEVGGETVYTFPDVEWWRLCRLGHPLELGILDAAERDGGMGIRRRLIELGIRAPPPGCRHATKEPLGGGSWVCLDCGELANCDNLA
jgi:hypothetical protein